jgi:hypothetical protein
MPTNPFNALTTQFTSSVDATQDSVPFWQANTASAFWINRNTWLNLASQPVGISDSQTLSNKTLDNTSVLTIKDGNYTLQNSSDTTKQVKWSLSGITTGTTRTLTLPDRTDTLVTLGGSQTLTSKTLTSPAINGGTIDNATVTVDSVAGHTSASTGTIYGISVTSGTIGAAGLASNAVTTVKLNNAAVTPDKLGTGAQAAFVSTSETTASTTYAFLATTSDQVTVTIGANGLALVCFQVTLANNTGGAFSFASVDVSGNNTIAAADNIAVALNAYTANASGAIGNAVLLTGLTPGSTTFKLKYRVTSNTGAFSNRRIAVVPL